MEQRDGHHQQSVSQSPKCGWNQRDKLRKTILLSLIFLIFGTLRAQEGVVFLDLILITNTDISRGSWLFTAGAAGFMSGVLILSPLFDKFNNDALFCVFTLLTGIITLIIPWCQSIYLMIVLFGLKNLFVAPADAGCFVICARLWQRDSGPFIQNLLFLFAIGGIVAPLVTEPFLAVQIPTNTTTQIPVNGNLHLFPVRNVVNRTADLDTDFNKTINSTLPLASPDSRVYVAFALTGGILLASCLFYGLNAIRTSAKVEVTDGMENSRRTDPMASFPLYAKFSSCVILSIASFSYGCIEKILFGFLMTFTVDYLQWNKADGSMATVVFWTGLAGGRLMGVFLIKFMASTTLLFIKLSGLFFTFGLLALADYFSWGKATWWLLIVASGVFLSSVLATFLCLVEDRVTPLSGRMMTFIYIWMFIGSTTHLSLLGYLFDFSSPIWFIYLLLIHSGIMLTSTGIMTLAVSRFTPIYPSEM